MPCKVKLTYFESSGKFYSEGEYESEHTHVFDIFKEVLEMQENKNLPGLTKGIGEMFGIRVDPDPVAHKRRHPFFLYPPPF